MLQWCCYYLRNTSSSSTREWNSRPIKHAFLMLQMEERLLPDRDLWLKPPGRVLTSVCEAQAVCNLSQDNHLARSLVCWLLRSILRCLSSGVAFYSLCEYMSYEHSSMGWQERQIRHQRMRNAEILAWLYGCIPAVSCIFTAIIESEALRSISSYAVAGNKE